ncbi:Cysteine synthase [Monocercomonoides exilis]|uniref:Cysteine synthase n=1 Tax=Monocercomonoides exilis TaxID=2049356 RepID=UPI003559CD84|nr:Cysteine synthase [Monocercomonoides exilis]|eukprot:MONOS_856.1-p1 / transcript=MONOS_856.1 / gene=MONOS_856 / organism=Monocercomonoides_exilis_PA203 / gene_product=Cysteine synthase / transcript_product=Cysteine synthase / location=Mono_scaffold00014:96607-98199(+) / protein_length=531 / sequence_SO=supercontig / SO=protein_coding / is_pseudo=false
MADTENEEIDEVGLKNAVERCKERGILIPTLEQLRHPELIPEKVKEELKTIGLWDTNSRNLFRITWKNEPVEKGGLYGPVNAMELPPSLTGVKSKIFVLLGKFFPTGCHKVGASFGPLVDRLTRGKFDPTKQKALWPSTGNYCRGGAFNSALLGCKAVAILPAGMSQERFKWLESIGSEIIATPGCESNVKEIFDKVNELTTTKGDEVVALNQFCEFMNPLWHYNVTGPAMEEVWQTRGKGTRLSGVFLTQGSAGTLASAEYLKKHYPAVKLGVGEAKQCPTLLENGFGDHRIEGIGDKHVPWIHNLKNTDLVASIDDEQCMHLVQLFQTEVGKKVLAKHGVPKETLDQLKNLGISGIANIIGAIKLCKYFEFNENDSVFTVATDSFEMYRSRLDEMEKEHGEYTETRAECDWFRYLDGISTDWMQECTHVDRRRMHHLKYYTWVEQQGKTCEELNAQWKCDKYWEKKWTANIALDERIRKFNEMTGLAEAYPAPKCCCCCKKEAECEKSCCCKKEGECEKACCSSCPSK